MKIAIVTAGAVGAFFGARFARQGAEVRFVARGAHLEALRYKGLTVETRNGSYELGPDGYKVSEDAATAVEGADLVLFVVKSFDTEAVAAALKPGLGPETVVLSLQNGFENEEILARTLGAERTAGGITYVFAKLTGPGRVAVPGDTARLVLAQTTLAGTPVPHLAEFQALCAAAGFPCETTPNLPQVKWTKLVFNSALNGWTTLHRTTLDRLLADPQIRPALIATMAETAAVARAAGVQLDDDIVEKQVRNAESLGAVGSSMLSDLEAGRKLEADGLNGAIARKGHELGVPTPYNEELYHKLTALSLH